MKTTYIDFGFDKSPGSFEFFIPKLSIIITIKCCLWNWIFCLSSLLCLTVYTVFEHKNTLENTILENDSWNNRFWKKSNLWKWIHRYYVVDAKFKDTFKQQSWMNLWTHKLWTVIVRAKHINLYLSKCRMSFCEMAPLQIPLYLAHSFLN